MIYKRSFSLESFFVWVCSQMSVPINRPALIQHFSLTTYVVCRISRRRGDRRGARAARRSRGAGRSGTRRRRGCWESSRWARLAAQEGRGPRHGWGRDVPAARRFARRRVPGPCSRRGVVPDATQPGPEPAGEKAGGACRCSGRREAQRRRL